MLVYLHKIKVFATVTKDFIMKELDFQQLIQLHFAKNVIHYVKLALNLEILVQFF